LESISFTLREISQIGSGEKTMTLRFREDYSRFFPGHTYLVTNWLGCEQGIRVRILNVTSVTRVDAIRPHYIPQSDWDQVEVPFDIVEFQRER
jgi:hypothetical protein